MIGEIIAVVIGGGLGYGGGRVHEAFLNTNARTKVQTAAVQAREIIKAKMSKAAPVPAVPAFQKKTVRTKKTKK